MDLGTGPMHAFVQLSWHCNNQDQNSELNRWGCKKMKLQLEFRILWHKPVYWSQKSVATMLFKNVYNRFLEGHPCFLPYKLYMVSMAIFLFFSPLFPDLIERNLFKNYEQDSSKMVWCRCQSNLTSKNRFMISIQFVFPSRRLSSN